MKNRKIWLLNYLGSVMGSTPLQRSVIESFLSIFLWDSLNVVIFTTNLWISPVFLRPCSSKLVNILADQVRFYNFCFDVLCTRFPSELRTVHLPYSGEYLYAISTLVSRFHTLPTHFNLCSPFILGPIIHFS